MPRKFITLCLAVATLAACTPQDAGLDIDQALQLADEMRAGCVASNLDLMMGLADRAAPLCEASSLQNLVDLASSWCTVTPGTERHILECEELQLGADVIDLHAELEYFGADGQTVVAPEDSVGLRVHVTATGLLAETTGILVCTPDPERGLVLSGHLITVFPDGCRVEADLNDLTALRIADGEAPLLITSGSVDISIDNWDEPVATGTAAIFGRNALVALEVDGIFSQGEIALGH